MNNNKHAYERIRIQRLLILILLLSSSRSRSVILVSGIASSQGSSEAAAVRNKGGTRTETTISVHEVTSFEDIRDLADLRYKEWIVGAATGHEPHPSLAAFRMATADIYAERQQQGAKAFLARCQETNVAVGSAELSPIEFKGCWTNNNNNGNNSNDHLYITDVVTLSSYRRRGIGNRILNKMEQEAANHLGASRICLHVAKGNVTAKQFYIHNGYSEYLDNNKDDGDENCGVIRRLNTNRLAENAGTLGQVLFMKQLEGKRNNTSTHTKSRQTSSRSTGFGGGVGGSAVNRKRRKAKK